MEQTKGGKREGEREEKGGNVKKHEVENFDENQ
jgi:hypothetical protein